MENFSADLIRFDEMKEEHRKDVMDIFNHYIENSFAAYPDEILPQGFFDKLIELTRGYPAYVVKYSSGIIGFCFLRPYNIYRTFKETAEITYFIKQDFTGKGIGKIILERLESDGRTKGISQLLASISSENKQSIAFHEKHGFSRCGQFRNVGRKFGQAFDVIWMQKKIS